MKKFELTTEYIIHWGRKLFRIKALVSFENVEVGELGGFVEREENLSQNGNAWVSGNARVSDNARVYGNAEVSGDNHFTYIHGFGSENRTTTFFKQKDGSIGVKCGCFYGTVDEFREKVKETHGESKYAKEYLLIADLMEFHFKDTKEQETE